MAQNSSTYPSQKLYHRFWILVHGISWLYMRLYGIHWFWSSYSSTTKEEPLLPLQSQLQAGALWMVSARTWGHQDRSLLQFDVNSNEFKRFNDLEFKFQLFSVAVVAALISVYALTRAKQQRRQQPKRPRGIALRPPARNVSASKRLSLISWTSAKREQKMSKWSQMNCKQNTWPLPSESVSDESDEEESDSHSWRLLGSQHATNYTPLHYITLHYSHYTSLHYTTLHLWRTEPATHWKSLKYFCFHFFLSFWLSLHSSFFIIYFIIFIFLTFQVSFFIIFKIIFYHFFKSFFIIFSSSGAKIFQKMENYNVPQVFFMFLSFFSFVYHFFYHFCFQWWLMKNDKK